MSPESIVQQAATLHSSGRLDEAERLYRSVLKDAPRNYDALHLLGVLLGQRGRHAESIPLIEQAIKLRPWVPDPVRNLARILCDAGRFADGAVWYGKATELTPTDPLAWYALGICQRKLGDLGGAISSQQRAIALSPGLVDAYLELGIALRSQRRLNEAMEAHARAYQLKPNSAPVLDRLGGTLLELNRSHEAIQAFYRATQLDPTNADYLFSLANALLGKRALNEALMTYDKVLEIQPRNSEAFCGRSRALSEMGRFEEALVAAKRAIEIEPANFKAFASLGDVYREMQHLPEAMAAYRQALERNPESAEYWICLGDCHRALGAFEKALEQYRRALSINPEHTLAHQMLALVTQSHSDHEVDKLRAVARDGLVERGARMAAGFAAGKSLDDADRYDEAFEEFSLANRLQRERMADDGASFEKSKLVDQVNESIRVFSPAFFEDRQHWGDSSEAPVFIVGMPRSGTTLVEQILASHSKVFGAGELSAIGSLASRLAGDQALPAATSWTESDITRFARSHLGYLRELGGEATRIVDKMPGNILHLGLIATLFPRARVIFCLRDPRDNCLSCYFQNFKANHISFSYSLEDCATQYLEQERLRAHWLKVLPLKLICVQYEELVADLEPQSRRLIDFLGLDWEPACLDFHKTERAVMTASVWQVRQPIYTTSAGRWKHYEKHLGPLLAMLGEQKLQP
jgi:tetratricopeptide (TPR) repeat protein